MSETPGDITPSLPTPEEAVAVARIRRWNHFYKIAVIWLIGWVGLIVEKIVNLDSVEAGLRNGLMRGAFVAPFLLIITLPLAWLGSRIGSLEKWRRYRVWFTFGLPSLFVLHGVVGALKERYFPQDEFQRITGVGFPRDARIERCVYDDGRFIYWDWIYELICPAEETDRLIREMKLEKATSTRGAPPAAGPRSKGWLMTEVWRGEGSSYGIFIQLQTDASHTKLRIHCYTAF
jgi:hypothetical protein